MLMNSGTVVAIRELEDSGSNVNQLCDYGKIILLPFPYLQIKPTC